MRKTKTNKTKEIYSLVLFVVEVYFSIYLTWISPEVVFIFKV